MLPQQQTQLVHQISPRPIYSEEERFCLFPEYEYSPAITQTEDVVIATAQLH